MKLVDKLHKKECCGCWACVNICPKKCIVMQQDSEGFLYPHIDTNKCIECGLCIKVCTSNNEYKLQYDELQYYAAINVSDKVRFKSSSGGVFYEISKYVIEESGAVYGAAYTDDFKIKHIRVSDINSIEKLQKSKYLQSEIGDAYTNVLQDLNNNIKVLFSGTPCQIMGLKKFLRGRKFQNLICVDIACHAVPSPLAWRAYIESIGLEDKIVSIDFRDKNYPWHNYTLTIKKKNGMKISEPCDKNPFMLGFIYNLYNRPSCHHCPAKSFKSGSDIMLADFWGIEKIAPDFDDNRGTSLIVIKTETGQNIINYIYSKFHLLNVGYEAVSSRTTTFIKSSLPHYRRDYFFKNIRKKKFDKLVLACLKHNAPFFCRIKRRLLKYFYNTNIDK